MSVALATVQAS